jgi:hypothetical protein
MRCRQVRANFVDLAGGSVPTSEHRRHLEDCERCSRDLGQFSATLNLLDDWQAPPDVSPFFMTRLRARLREEGEADRQSALHWWAAWALTACVAVGLLLTTTRPFDDAPPPPKKASAVHDLENLDRYFDLLADPDFLDASPSNAR